MNCANSDCEIISVMDRVIAKQEEIIEQLNGTITMKDKIITGQEKIIELYQAQLKNYAPDFMCAVETARAQRAAQ